MKEIFVFLATGFEEIEALATVDILRRAELPVRTVSLEDSLAVAGKHGVPVTADVMFAQADLSGALMLVIPGGTVRYADHGGLRETLAAHAARGGWVAAICAAPMLPGQMGLLRGRRATCYPGFEKYLDGAIIVTDPVVVDGNFITGRGPGMAIDFALEIVRRIAGEEAAREVARGLLLA